MTKFNDNPQKRQNYLFWFQCKSQWLAKLLLAFWLTTTATAAFCSYKEENTLIIGVNHYPPHINTDNKRITGAARDYIEQLAQHAGYKTRFTRLPLKRQYDLLTSGDIDLAFPVYPSNELDINYVSNEPMSYTVPGLCFRKADFIPLLSLTERWKDLKIVYPGGLTLIPILKKYNHHLEELMGDNAIDRSVKLVMLRRAQAAYVPNVHAIYHINSQYYDSIACSSFYGDVTPVFLAASNKMPKPILAQIKQVYTTLTKYNGSKTPLRGLKTNP